MNFFLSPGFGGLCAVIGAAIAYAAATLATRQKRKADTAVQREGEVARVWDRFVWVMDHREEFNPILTLDLLGQLVTTADRLADRDLVSIGRRITTELYRDILTPPDPPPSTTSPGRADTDQDDQEGA